MKKEISHGGAGTSYTHYGCRCEDCTEANRKRVARRSAERNLEPKDPNDPRHGTISFYNNHGCRCDRCKAENSRVCKSYYESRKAK